ncbi:MAG: hypothetical protein AABW92_05640 [Nanoarchaeota archaeon]
MDQPISNIKEYIVSRRKQQVHDSNIINSLRGASWPDDIIETAFQDANKIIEAVPEPVAAEKKEEQEEIQETSSNDDKEEKEEVVEKPAAEKVKKEKKSFSIMALFAFIFSPIPFIGLGVAMAAFDDIKKNNKTGKFLAFLALIINFAIIVSIIYFFYQIFNLPPDKLAGFASVINDMFNLV